MATELHVRIRPNPYQGHEAVFWWNGMLNRYSFELRTELAIKLVDDCVPQPVIDEVMDSLDVFEWDQPEYPLGVVWVGEAVCDCNEPVEYDRHRDAIEQLRIQNAGLWWNLETAKAVIGMSFVVIAFLIWRLWA